MRVNVEFAAEVAQFVLQTSVSFHVRFSQIEHHALPSVKNSILRQRQIL